MIDIIYLITELIIFISFLYRDFTYKPTSMIKYAGIILCVCYSIYRLIKMKNRKRIIITIALLFTLIADYFLLVIDKYYEIGIFCFCIVQTLYFVIYFELKLLFIRLGLFVFLIVLIPIINVEMSLQNALAVYSIINLSFNVLMAYQKKDYWLFSALLLFWFCDINVGLYNLSLPKKPLFMLIEKIAGYCMWLFYLPSQVLLAYKGDYDYEKK